MLQMRAQTGIQAAGASGEAKRPGSLKGPGGSPLLRRWLNVAVIVRGVLEVLGPH